jgi:hypothetical protein
MYDYYQALVGVLLAGSVVWCGLRWTQTRKLRISIFLAGIGYLGACLYYGYLIGLDSQTQLACPICPYLIGGWTPIKKFIVWSLVFGGLNSITLITASWLLSKVFVIVRRMINV